MPTLLLSTVGITLCVALIGFQAGSVAHSRLKSRVQQSGRATGLRFLSWFLFVGSFYWAVTKMGWGQGISFWLCAVAVIGLATLYIRESAPSLYRWLCWGAPIVGGVICLLNIQLMWIEGGG